MKTIVNLFLLIGLFVTGTVQAQRISPKMSVRLNTPQKLSIKTPTQDCKETLRIKVEGGRVHTPQHTPTDKVKSWSSNGHFFIRAVKPIKEGDFIWAKFYMKPGYPTADVTGLDVAYSVQPRSAASKSYCYISQTRIAQGASPNVGTVRLDDPKNLFGSGVHSATPFGGKFACGNDYKTIALKLVMQPGDLIVIKGLRVSFDCPSATPSIVCPVNLPDPLLKYGGSEISGNYVRHKIPVSNWNAYPGLLFAAAPYLPACGSNANSSRTWVDIYDENNNRLYGFCALGNPSNLQNLWFAVKKGEQPPYRVRIVMRDRACGVVYNSNWISIPQT